ncbi:MAG TPA: acyl carrier protein [Gemmatimonadaceae bacterium]|jgi:acyl carrier protein|nr:acyl carrier protein [Gemmatimonadaceae bacterium]
MLTHEIEFTPGVSESSILSRVRGFVQGNSLYRQHGYVLDGDDRFFERIALDSRYVAAMISFIEDEFGIHVSDCEIREDNLRSLRAVARFVASKQPYAVG